MEGHRVQVTEQVVVDGCHAGDASPVGFARPALAFDDGPVGIAELSSGIRLCHEAFGNPLDPVVLLMHGLGSQLLLWEEGFCEGLASEGFRVVRYDHRDSGCSTVLEEGSAYTLSDQVADAVGLLDHLGASDAHVVGMSMGGMIAQTFAMEHPGRCRSMVSMASNTGNRDFGRPSGTALEAMMAPAPADPAAAVEKELSDRRIWASIWHDDDHARAVFAAYAARSVQPRHAFDRQVAAVLAHGSREDRLATITVPTRVIHGTVDTLIAASGGERTAAVIPGADLVMVEGWGHDMAPGAWPQLIDAIVTHCHRADGAA
jgi:pimeloyl-ACP methyl ester carboxylesterase